MSGKTGVKEFPCSSCGAKLAYEPGTQVTKCAHCGAETVIPQSEDDVRELDLEAYFADAENETDTHEQLTVKCDACGAEATLEPDVTSATCPFCGSPIVAQQSSKKLLRPIAVLPFRITAEEARASFFSWIDGLWFAPGDLKKRARAEGKLSGVYLPYWTYDAATTTFYRGQRGEDYTETETYTENETYTETDSQGRTQFKTRVVTKTRQVTKTRWYSVSGTVWNEFDDLLVRATDALPPSLLEKLEPWDLENLIPYTDDYLAGFRTQSYSIGLLDGFDVACDQMEPAIHSSICRDIGGDHQRIDSKKTQYDQVTFKHILLPVYLNVYRYGDRVFRFFINARTGEVQGERPWSFTYLLVILLVIVAIVVVVGVISNAAG